MNEIRRWKTTRRLPFKAGWTDEKKNDFTDPNPTHPVFVWLLPLFNIVDFEWYLFSQRHWLNITFSIGPPSFVALGWSNTFFFSKLYDLYFSKSYGLRFHVQFCVLYVW